MSHRRRNGTCTARPAERSPQGELPPRIVAKIRNPRTRRMVIGRGILKVYKATTYSTSFASLTVNNPKPVNRFGDLAGKTRKERERSTYSWPSCIKPRLQPNRADH